MSKISNIEYNNKGFWIPESFIEVLSDYICKTFETIGINLFSDNLKEIYDDCNSNRQGVRMGMVDISFDDYITNNSEKLEVLQVLNQTKIAILNIGSEISIASLNQFENRKINDYFKSDWNFPIKTQSLASTIDIIAEMINGTWPSSNYSVYFVGFPNTAGRPEI